MFTFQKRTSERTPGPWGPRGGNPVWESRESGNPLPEHSRATHTCEPTAESGHAMDVGFNALALSGSKAQKYEKPSF